MLPRINYATRTLPKMLLLHHTPYALILVTPTHSTLVGVTLSI